MCAITMHTGVSFAQQRTHTTQSSSLYAAHPPQPNSQCSERRQAYMTESIRKVNTLTRSCIIDVKMATPNADELHARSLPLTPAASWGSHRLLVLSRHGPVWYARRISGTEAQDGSQNTDGDAPFGDDPGFLVFRKP
eukprot:54473-Eustigmatos_ZCMA.PRE.1